MDFSKYAPIPINKASTTTNRFSRARAFPPVPSLETASEESEDGIPDECLWLIAAARRAFTAAQTARSRGDEHNAALYLMLAQRRAQYAIQIQARDRGWNREFE